MVEPHRRRPPDETLAWAARSVAPGATVVGWRRLTGGAANHAAVHRLSVRTRDGSTTQVVLRRWLPDSDRARRWMTSVVANEAGVLDALEAAGLPAPRCVAATPTGEEAGGSPAILMSRAPGAMNLTPRDPKRWIREIAVMLPRIHAVEADAGEWQRWTDLDALEVPTWSAHSGAWRDAIELARTLDGAADATFIHRDYQHFNMLWRGDRLTSVVDWVSGSHGPPGIDVGHCRLNLAVLFSAEWADEFRDIYEAEAGRSVDPAADVLSILSYSRFWHDFIPKQVDGRARIDHDGMDARVDTLLARAVTRAHA